MCVCLRACLHVVKCIFLYNIIYIYIYVAPPHGPWFGAFDLYFLVVYAIVLLLGLGVKIEGCHMICMRAYICDKSNDISICNLKEFECIQEYLTNSDVFRFLQMFGFKIKDSII